jgi:hypothetical protein
MRPEATALASLSAVLGHDLDQVRSLQGQLQDLGPALAKPSVEFRDLAAVGYLLHNTYNALENSFGQISRTFENHIVDPGRWHKELLDKMFLEIPGLRPAVLPPNLRPVLNDLRGFRHIFRHSYDFELDVGRLQELYRRWAAFANPFMIALEAFRQSLLKQAER